MPVKVFDPYNVTRVGTTSQYTRAQFPTFTDAAGLVHTTALPTARLNAQGLALLKAYPLPNRTPDDVFNNNNFFLSRAANLPQKQCQFPRRLELAQP